MSPKIPPSHPMLSDGYVKYKEVEVHRSAIMQDFQDSDKKNQNGRLAAIFYFISAKFDMGYPYKCES